MQQINFDLKKTKIPFHVGKFEDVAKYIKENLTKSLIILPTSLNDLASIWHYSHLAKFYSEVDISTTDGMPLVYWLRFRTGAKIERVYGPELMEYIVEHSPENKTHYVLAANQLVEKKIVNYFGKRNLNSQLIGSSYLEKGEAELKKQAQIIKELKRLNPSILWLGIGSPKQVELAGVLKNKLPNTTIFCVGAAFDFLTDVKPMAPKFIRNVGLEWLFRLLTEPKRLWKRYFVLGPSFVIQYVLQRKKKKYLS